MVEATQHLTSNECAQLAREVAVDAYRMSHKDETEQKVECEDCGSEFWIYFHQLSVDAAVKHGWDAALEWARESDDNKLRLISIIVTASMKLDVTEQQLEQSIEEIGMIVSR